MSKSPTPKGTPVQRSPSDGVPEGLQSPQHSTPGSGPQHKKRISSLLQSPVRLLSGHVCMIYCLCLFPLSFSVSRSSPLNVIIFHIRVKSSQMPLDSLGCRQSWTALWVHNYLCSCIWEGNSEATWLWWSCVWSGEGDHEVKGLMERGWLMKYVYSHTPLWCRSICESVHVFKLPWDFLIILMLWGFVRRKRDSPSYEEMFKSYIEGLWLSILIKL